MKLQNIAATLLIICSLSVASYAQISQCRVSATVYLPNGQPDTNASVTVFRVVLGGQIYSNTRTVVARANSSGVLTSTVDGLAGFDLPRGSTAYLYSNASGLSNLSANAASGSPFEVPSISTADLDDLVPLTGVLRVKGDLVVAGSGGVARRLAIGTNGYLPFADSTASLGMEWKNPATALAATFQPLDSDLTAIAALTTTSFGRGLLTETNAASLKTTISLNNVENTALSTWAGSTNLTTLGTVATGAWNGTTIGTQYGGSGANLSATGGSGQYVKQTSVGGAFSVGVIGASDLPTAIDAAKVADGSVSNAEFQRLDGVSSGIQSQLDGKQATGNYITALTGDVSASGPGSAAATLATVNGNVGSFGSATQVGAFTVNGKGLITAANNVTVTPAVGSITGLGTDVATALSVNVGSAGAFVVFNGALGTPSSGTLSNATGLPVATGISGLGSGVATLLATPSSANLRAALTDENGTGAALFDGATSPAFVTPVLGVASATSINKVAITAPASSATLTIADGKTATFSNSITIAGTDSSTLNVGTGGTLGTAAYKSTGTSGNTVPLLDGANTFSAAQVVSSASASCFSVGANGDTNPVLRAKCNTASVATGIEVQGAAAGGGLTLQVISSGGTENLNIRPKGSGANLSFHGDVFGIVGTSFNAQLWNNGQFAWSSGANALSAADLGIKRAAAGVGLVTNGSTGVGSFGFALPPSSKTADYTVLNTETGTAFDNIGAGAGVTFTLPTPAAGLNYRFCRVDNQTVTLDIGGSVTIRLGASVTTAGGNVTLDAVGSCAILWAVSTTKWFGVIEGAATFN